MQHRLEFAFCAFSTDQDSQQHDSVVAGSFLTAEAARQSLQSGLTIAFKSGAITGFFVVGFGLLGLVGYYWFLYLKLGESQGREIVEAFTISIGQQGLCTTVTTIMIAFSFGFEVVKTYTISNVVRIERTILPFCLA